MAQFKNTTINDTGFIRLPIGTTGQRPSGTQGMTRYNTSNNVIEFFNGTSWIGIGLLDGSSQSTAAPSAQSIKNITSTNTNTSYWIALPTVGATNLFCIMDSAYNGGGWMMTMKATRGTTFNYNSGYWTGNNLLNESSISQSDADAKFNSFNYFPAKDMMARWPDIGSGGSIGGLGNWIWLQNDFINGARATPLAFHSAPQNYARWNGGTGNGGTGNFVQDAKTYSGWANGVFSSQVDIRFYGFNYTNNPTYGLNARVRWGFGWNENSEGLYPSSGGAAPGSNDVSGGIGMDSGFQTLSAGDRINCCQDTTGINRSARVEIYVR